MCNKGRWYWPFHIWGVTGPFGDLPNGSGQFWMHIWYFECKKCGKKKEYRRAVDLNDLDNQSYFDFGRMHDE